MLRFAATVPGRALPGKGFGALAIVIGLLTSLLLPACGREEEGRAPRPAIVPPSYPGQKPVRIDVPERPPTPEEKIAHYVGLLGTGDQEEVAWATEQLRRAGAKAVPALAKRLEQGLSRNAMLAENVLAVFRDHLDPKPVFELVRRAATHRADRVRAAAAAVLGRTGAREAVPPLLDLAAEGSPLISKPALTSLRELGFEEGGRGLLGRFRTVLTPVLKAPAIPVIARLLPEEEAVKFLEGLLKEKDLVLVIRAAQALQELGRDAGREELYRRYRAGGLSPSHEEALLNALGSLRDTRVLPELIERSRSGSPIRRQFAVAVLGEYRLPAARAALWEATKAPYPSLRLEAWHSLWLARDDEVLPRLHLLLRSRDAVRRRNAAVILGRIKAPESVPHLAGALQTEEDLSLLPHLAMALADIGDPAGALPIVRAMDREPESEASLALIANNLAKSLIRFRELGEEAQAALIARLESQRLSLRLNAIRVLARRGKGPKVKAALEASLFDSSPDVREMAALGWLRMPGASLEPLRKLCKSERDPVRAATIAGIAERLAYRWDE